MPNAIKYNTSAETLALKKGNFYIGTGDVGKGPTSSTGYYNGITPPTGGYAIYLNKASGGPSIYTASAAQLISITNSIAGTSYTSVADSLNWYTTQPDKMVLNMDYPSIITNGLVLFLDAGFSNSYPTMGSTCYDLTSSPADFSLQNGLTVVNDYFSFDGTDDSLYYGSVPSKLQFTSASQFTYIFGARPVAASGGPFLRAGGNAYSFFPREGNIQFHSLGPTYGYGNNAEVYLPNMTMGNNHFVVCRVNNLVFDAFVDGSFSSTANIPEQSIGGGWLSFFNTVDNGGQKLAGRLYFAYAYNRVLSNTEITSIYNSQKTRLGL
jgi:hypothetical protein